MTRLFNRLFANRKNIQKQQPARSSAGICMEALEERQLMSVSLPDSPFHAPVETSTISMSLHHRAKAEPNLDRSSLVTSGATRSRGAEVGRANGKAEPYVTQNGLRLVNFSGNPLFSGNGPSMNDINQGSVGDCFFLSALAEEAAHDPARIRSLVSEHSDGTYDVYFYHYGWVDEHINGLLPVEPNGQLAYADLGQGNCTWVAIMEKAFCYFRAGLNGQAASYGAINGGPSAEALGDMGLGILGDYGSNSFSSGYSLASYVYGQLQYGRNVELITSSVNVSGGLIATHAYAVIGAYQSGGTTWIQLRTPWGIYSPGGQAYVWVNANTVLYQMGDVVVATA
jgi:hypothetical protein